MKNDDPHALQTNARVEEKVILVDNKTVRSQLLLKGTKMEDIGKYNCVANNSAGERVSRVSSLFTEDLGKRHSFFAPENDNLFLKTVQMIYPKSFVTMSRQKEGYETKLASTWSDEQNISMVRGKKNHRTKWKEKRKIEEEGKKGRGREI